MAQSIYRMETFIYHLCLDMVRDNIYIRGMTAEMANDKVFKGLSIGNMDSFCRMQHKYIMLKHTLNKDKEYQPILCGFGAERAETEG